MDFRLVFLITYIFVFFFSGKVGISFFLNLLVRFRIRKFIFYNGLYYYSIINYNILFFSFLWLWLLARSGLISYIIFEFEILILNIWFYF